MRIVLLGAPGSGKGTQSQRLMHQLHIPQISTGDLLRAAVAGDTELGRKAREAMDGGRLVADELVLGLIRERLAEPDTRRGFILDGFPRNLAQAQALDRLLATRPSRRSNRRSIAPARTARSYANSPRLPRRGSR